MSIHPTAIITAGAKIHPTVEVGPYTFIGPNVEIGEKTVVGSNCHIEGYTTIGVENRISPFVSIGCPPQDRKFSGEKSFVKIGNGNHIREFVTIHMAEGAGNETIIGDKNLLMAYVHVAHNCRVGNGVTLANCVTLAGHVHVDDKATLGGFAGIHQFCKIGGMVMIGGMSKIVKDVPPFIMIDGNPACVIGLNSVGLRRNGVPRESITAMRNMFKMFFRSNMNVTQAKEKLATMPEANDPFVRQFVDFLGTCTRGVYTRTRDAAADREAAE